MWNKTEYMDIAKSGKLQEHSVQQMACTISLLNCFIVRSFLKQHCPLSRLSAIDQKGFDTIRHLSTDKSSSIKRMCCCRKMCDIKQWKPRSGQCRGQKTVTVELHMTRMRRVGGMRSAIEPLV